MTNSTLKRTQVYLDTESLIQAKKLAKSHKTTVSKLLRTALKTMLESNNSKVKKPTLRTVTLKDPTIKNYSEQIDNIYDNKLK